MNKVELYKVPKNSRIKIEGFTVDDKLTEEINFYHTDGMYSFCTTDEGIVIHLMANTLVEVVKTNSE